MAKIPFPMRSGESGCVVCDAAQAEARPERPASTARRNFMKGALAAPFLLSPLEAFAERGIGRRARFHPRGRGRGRAPAGPFVVDAGLALVYEDGALRVREGVSILVRNGWIEDVRQRPIRGFRKIDAHRQFVVPGFISGHTHVAGGTPTRGIIEMGRSFARPLEIVEDLSDDDLDALTAFNLAELLLSGCTTHIEQSLSLRQAQSYVRVARRWGVRGYPGGMVPGIARLFPIWFRSDDQTLFDSVPGTLAEIQANLEFARSVNGAENGRILPMMTPHAADTQTPETMAAYAAGAAELGNGIHTHLSQSTRETETVKRLWGVTPTQWSQQFGFFEGPFFGAHMSGMDFDIDPPIMNAEGGVYAHNPSAGGAGGGTQPYPEALALGMNVNVGIDTHSNDYVENLKLAVLYGQARHSLIASTSPIPLQRPSMWDAIHGGTVVAAKGLGRDDLGRIAPGAKADLVGIDVTGPLVGVGTLPPEPLNNLLYASGAAVRTTMTDGNLQVLGGEFVVDDFDRVERRGGEVVRALWARLAEEGFFD